MLPRRIVLPCAMGLCIALASSPAAASDSWEASSKEAVVGLFATPQDPSPQKPPPPPDEPIQVPASSSAPPVEPEHTGFAALAKDTARDFGSFPKRRSTWAILAIGAAMSAASHPIDGYMNGHLARTNKWSHGGFDLLRAQALSQALVHGIKYSVQRDRPTGECCSFPSGHAATAFAAASVLERHLGYRMAWPTLVAATHVATSRMHDNRHFLSDVVFGAAVGTATGWTVVGRHGRDRYTLIPSPTHGGVMVTLAHAGD